MTILKEFGINGDKKLRYNLCKGSGQNMSDMVGQRLAVKAYILMEDADQQSGELVKSLKVLTEDDEIVGTRSQSFIAGFEDFLTCMESDECTEMEICQRRSKAGRNYITFKA